MDSGGLLSTIFGILVFIAAVYAIAKTINSSATTGKKVLWIIVILLLPLIGPIAWYFLGPK